MLQKTCKTLSRGTSVTAGLVLCGIAALSMAGCGGSDSTPGGGTASPYAGNYRGVYLNTAGPGAPASGTLLFNVAADGTVIASGTNTNTGAGVNGSGTISNSGAAAGAASLTFGAGSGAATGTFTQNTALRTLAATLTSATGNVVTLNLGPAFIGALPIAGTYTGTGTQPGKSPVNMTMVILSSGTVTANIAASSPIQAAGYIDSNNIIYLAFQSGGGSGNENVVGQLTAAGSGVGATLTGTVADTSTGGAPSTVTLNLTRTQ